MTAPKPSGPAPPTVTGILEREPARGPGQLLVGASLTALREHRLVDQAVDHAAPPEKGLALIRKARDRLHAHAKN